MKLKRLLSLFLAAVMTTGLSVGGVCAADAPEELPSAPSTIEVPTEESSPSAEPKDPVGYPTDTGSLLLLLQEKLLDRGADQTQIDTALQQAQALPPEVLQSLLQEAEALTAVELLSRIAEAAAEQGVEYLPPMDSFPGEDIPPEESVSPSVPVEPAPEESQSVPPVIDAFPEESAPAIDTFPEETAPPVDTAPVESDPVPDALPSESLPVEETPGEALPPDSAPGVLLEETEPTAETMTETDLAFLRTCANGSMTEEQLLATVDELFAEGMTRADILQYFAAMQRQEVQLYAASDKVETTFVNVTVDVPASRQITINPYELPVSYERDPTKTSYDSIFMEPIKLTNNRTKEVEVTVTATVQPTQSVVIVDKNPRGPDAVPTDERRVFLFMEMKNGSGEMSWTDPVNAVPSNTLAVIPTPSTAANNTLTTTLYGAGKGVNTAQLKINGDCSIPSGPTTWQSAREYTTSDGMVYTEADGVVISLIFDFVPKDEYYINFLTVRYDTNNSVCVDAKSFADVYVDGNICQEGTYAAGGSYSAGETLTRPIYQPFNFKVSLDPEIAALGGYIYSVAVYEDFANVEDKDFLMFYGNSDYNKLYSTPRKPTGPLPTTLDLSFDKDSSIRIPKSDQKTFTVVVYVMSNVVS